MIQTNFESGLYVNGPANGSVIPVLSYIVTHNGAGARYTFVYNSYGQVNAIWRYGAENNQRTARVYNYNLSGPLSDCPRFYSRQDWAYEWIDNTPGPTNWVYTNFQFDQSDANGRYGQVTLPDGTIHKEYFATSGWQRGLTTRTETWVEGVKKKWATFSWEHSGTATVQKNPRVNETNVYDDAGNRRRR